MFDVHLYIIRVATIKLLNAFIEFTGGALIRREN